MSGVSSPARWIRLLEIRLLPAPVRHERLDATRARSNFVWQSNWSRGNPVLQEVIDVE
jgi:hypothetical protein